MNEESNSNTDSKIKEHIKFGWRRLAADWRPYIEQTVSRSDMDNMMRQSSIPSFGYFFLLVMSCLIATFGLLSNSAPAIIGAMIIAPLMAPIMSMAHGLVIARYARIIRSFLTILAGVIVVIALSYFVTELVGIGIASSEIISRTQPTLLDLGVAIAAGASAAFAYSRSSVMNSIAGVAIAVALVPPLAVVGIGLSIDQPPNIYLDHSLKETGVNVKADSIAKGAFLLFLTNLVAIIISAGVVMICQGYGSLKRGSCGLLVMSGFMLAMLEPLGDSLHRIYIESQVRKITGELVRDVPKLSPPRGWLESMHVRYVGELPYIFVRYVTPRDQVEDLKAILVELQREVSSQIGESVQIRMTTVPVDIEAISIGSGVEMVEPEQ